MFNFQDKNANTDSVDFTIEFTPEDLSPPIFNETFYYSQIPKPIYDTNYPMTIEPNDISAYDGDVDINAKIIYNIEDGICKKSFDLDQNGKVTWIGEVDWDCPKSDNIYLTVKAC